MSHSYPDKKGKKKKRVRNWTADDRAVHRAFERSRREAFKERLQKLASLVPGLQNVEPSKLSKHVVLDASIALLAATNRKAAESQIVISSLLTEREQLFTEVNVWRTGAGIEPICAPAAEGHASKALGANEIQTGNSSMRPLEHLDLDSHSVVGEQLPFTAGAPFDRVASASASASVLPQTETLGIGMGDIAQDVVSWQAPQLAAASADVNGPSNIYSYYSIY